MASSLLPFGRGQSQAAIDTFDFRHFLSNQRSIEHRCFKTLTSAVNNTLPTLADFKSDAVTTSTVGSPQKPTMVTIEIPKNISAAASGNPESRPTCTPSQEMWWSNFHCASRGSIVMRSPGAAVLSLIPRAISTALCLVLVLKEEVPSFTTSAPIMLLRATCRCGLSTEGSCTRTLTLDSVPSTPTAGRTRPNRPLASFTTFSRAWAAGQSCLSLVFPGCPSRRVRKISITCNADFGVNSLWPEDGAKAGESCASRHSMQGIPMSAADPAGT
jgi:hypothetical protein